jgi:hypothetical protein
MAGLVVFDSVAAALKAGNHVYDRTDDGYLVRTRTARGWALAIRQGHALISPTHNRQVDPDRRSTEFEEHDRWQTPSSSTPWFKLSKPATESTATTNTAS